MARSFAAGHVSLAITEGGFHHGHAAIPPEVGSHPDGPGRADAARYRRLAARVVAELAAAPRLVLGGRASGDSGWLWTARASQRRGRRRARRACGGRAL